MRRSMKHAIVVASNAQETAFYVLQEGDFARKDGDDVRREDVHA